MKKISLSIQILSIISIASFSGAMLMLYTGPVSFWKKIPPDDFLNWFSNHSSGIEITIGPLVILSMLLPLISVFSTWKIPKSRIYWLISFLFLLGIMAITLSFFLETNSAFAAKSIELDQVNEKLNTWDTLHSIRVVMGFLSAIFAGIGFIRYMSNTVVSNLE